MFYLQPTKSGSRVSSLRSNLSSLDRTRAFEPVESLLDKSSFPPGEDSNVCAPPLRLRGTRSPCRGFFTRPCEPFQTGWTLRLQQTFSRTFLAAEARTFDDQCGK